MRRRHAALVIRCGPPESRSRKQIHDCALFIPIISASTQARPEGYFRLEWKLAVERTHLMSDRVTFLVPVVIDATRDEDADAPDAFKAAQWTRLPAGDTSRAFVERISRLLLPEVSAASGQTSPTTGALQAHSSQFHQGSPTPGARWWSRGTPQRFKLTHRQGTPSPINRSPYCHLLI